MCQDPYMDVTKRICYFPQNKSVLVQIINKVEIISRMLIAISVCFWLVAELGKLQCARLYFMPVLGKATSLIWLCHHWRLLEVLLQCSGVTWEERLSGVWSGIQVASVFADWDKHSSFSHRELQPNCIPSFSSSYLFSGKMSCIYLAQLSTLMMVEPVSCSTFAST